MGEIIESRRRHYVGLDADKDTIPAAGKSEGDSFHANDKGKQYYWDGANWKTGLGYEYVPRDVADVDFDQTDFTQDGAWHENEINCSVIVPAGAVAIHFRIKTLDDAALTFAGIRGNATTKDKNRLLLTSQVANIPREGHCVINCDSDRLIDAISSAAVGSIELVILGWYI